MKNISKIIVAMMFSVSVALFATASSAHEKGEMNPCAKKEMKHMNPCAKEKMEHMNPCAKEEMEHMNPCAKKHNPCDKD